MIPEDVWTALWAKFSFITPLSGLGSVTGAPMGVLRSRPASRALLAAATEEIVQLAADHGVKLPHDLPARHLATIDEEPPGATTSMQRDFAAGRPTELETLTGAVVRLAAETGTAVPVNAFMYEVLAIRSGDVGAPAR